MDKESEIEGCSLLENYSRCAKNILIEKFNALFNAVERSIDAVVTKFQGKNCFFFFVYS